MTDTTPAKNSTAIKNSKLVKILLVLFVLAIVFWAGVVLGYRKAEFSYRFSDNYFRGFGMHDRRPPNVMGATDIDGLIGGHGAVGKVISVNLPLLVVSDRNGTEKNIIINNETTIRAARSTTASTTIRADDFVTVIGTPNDDGSITAKLIRVAPPMPMPGLMRTSTSSPSRQ